MRDSQLYADARFPEGDLVARLQAYAARSGWDADRAAVPQHGRPLCAVIVGDPVIGGTLLAAPKPRTGKGGCVVNVRVTPVHSVVRRLISIGKCEVVRSDETIPAVAHLGAAAN